jgi:undecaprenyl-diphosphatase
MSDVVLIPSLVYSILLAIVQGVTEFLPVSSSGHLAAAQLVWPSMAFPGEIFEVAVHLGTTAAVVAYYRDVLLDLVRGFKSDTPVLDLTPKRWASYVVIASIPTAAIGLGFEDYIRGAFERLGAIAVFLAITGLVLMATRFAPRRDMVITPWIALAIGVIQGAAILPGISRSGMTISLALLLGIAHRQAVTFSFLVSVPAVLGAAALTGLDLLSESLGPSILFVNIGFASLCSGAIGYVCIGLVHRATEDRWWHRFAWYLWILAAVLAWLALGVSD